MAGIKEFITKLADSGGVAYSNTYEVVFNGFGSIANDELRQAGFSVNNSSAGALGLLTLLCEEASLPGILANTGQTTGKFLGEGQVNYAHTKSYQDLTLGWTCDANLLPLKFLNGWSRAIFNDSGPRKFSTTRLNYPDEYMCRTMTITKGERNRRDTLGRKAGVYTFSEVWPYAIQSTPVSYGSSQLLKVSASFYYRNWTFQGFNGAKVVGGN